MTDILSATHIHLICWGNAHVHAISPERLRQLRTAPLCTAVIDGDICGRPIWAVDHEGEPRRYVGLPPHQNWERWAECLT